MNNETLKAIWKKPYTKYILAGVLIVLIVVLWPVRDENTQQPSSDIQANHTPIPCHREATGGINETFPSQPNATQPVTAQVESNEQITVSGTIIDTKCQPIANAVITFWETDANGRYNERSVVQSTDAKGKYSLQTSMPQAYGKRAPHLNITIQSTSQAPIFKTQLFFADNPANRKDRFYDDSLLLKQESPGYALYNFVVERPPKK